MGKSGGQKKKKVFRKVDLSEIVESREGLPPSQDSRRSYEDSSYSSSRSKWGNSRDNSDSNAQNSNSSWRDDFLSRDNGQSSAESSTNWRSDRSSGGFSKPSTEGTTWGRRNREHQQSDLKKDDENCGGNNAEKEDFSNSTIQEELQPSSVPSNSWYEESESNESEAAGSNRDKPPSTEVTDKDPARPYSVRSNLNLGQNSNNSSQNYRSSNFSRPRNYEETGGSSNFSRPRNYEETSGSSESGNWRSERSSSDSFGRAPMNKDRRESSFNKRGSYDRPSERNNSDDFGRNRYSSGGNRRDQGYSRTEDSGNDGGSWRQDRPRNSLNDQHSESPKNGDRKDNSRTSFGKKLFLGNLTDEQKSFLSFYDTKADYSKVKEEDQDLFEVGEDFALAHCVAEDFNMGSGIAVEFRARFKKVAELLDQNAKSGGLAILEIKGRFIYYLVTKRESRGKPTYDTIWSSLQKMRTHIQENNVKKLAIPRIGCGLDKLDWDTVKQMIEFLFKNEDIDILVCNHVPEGSNNTSVKKCRSFSEVKQITEIAPETVIIYFASRDGKLTDTMKNLDNKFKFASHFEKEPKIVGETVRLIPMFHKNYVLYGCIVKENYDDPFSYVAFANCLRSIRKNSKTDSYYYMAFQSEQDDLLNAKILNLMKHSLKDLDIYVCGYLNDTSSRVED